MSSESFIMVLTTCPSESSAEKILVACLQNRIVACGQISPRVKSMYWWHGKIEKSEEYILLLKTRRALFSKVAEKVKEFHEYEVPEILSFSVDQGAPSYLNWVFQETQ